MSSVNERMASNTKLPYGVRKAFANAPEPSTLTHPWVTLWRECVARAIMDALGFTGQTETDKHNTIMLDAQKWFKYAHEDMQEVFDLADLPLEITRESVMENFPLTRKSSRIRRESTKRTDR